MVWCWPGAMTVCSTCGALRTSLMTDQSTEKRLNSLIIFIVNLNLCYPSIECSKVLYSHCFLTAPCSAHQISCVGGCWDWTQDCCHFGIDRQTLYNHSARSHPLFFSTYETHLNSRIFAAWSWMNLLSFPGNRFFNLKFCRKWERYDLKGSFNHIRMLAEGYLWVNPDNVMSQIVFCFL